MIFFLLASLFLMFGLGYTVSDVFGKGTKKKAIDMRDLTDEQLMNVHIRVLEEMTRRRVEKLNPFDDLGE